MRQLLSLPSMSRFEDREDYLERSDIALYLRDVVRLLLANRTERPLDFIHQYFRSVLNGDNIVLREFGYVNASPRNRISFIMNFEEAYKDSTCTESITPEDYHQLLKLLCPDFPLGLVNRAVYMLLSNRHEKLPFAALSMGVQLCFFYSEYLEEVRLAYMHKKGGRTERASIKIPTAQEENEDELRTNDLDLDHLSLGKEGQHDCRTGHVEMGNYNSKSSAGWDVPADENRQAILAKLKIINSNTHIKYPPPPLSIVEACVKEAPTSTFRQFCDIFLRSEELLEWIQNAHSSHKDLDLREASIPVEGEVKELSGSRPGTSSADNTGTSGKKRRSRDRKK